MGTVRLAVDIGGTFTDVALETGDRLTTKKLLTTAEAPAVAVLEGVTHVLDEAGLSPSDVDVFVHGTTLATNALIERRGAKTALLTSAGMRDSIEMAHENRFEQYDLAMVRPEPLVPRDRRIGIPERLSATGAVLLKLDEQFLREKVSALRDDGVESIVIGFLHSYMDPRHEIRAREIVESLCPNVSICLLYTSPSPRDLSTSRMPSSA